MELRSLARPLIITQTVLTHVNPKRQPGSPIHLDGTWLDVTETAVTGNATEQAVTSKTRPGARIRSSIPCDGSDLYVSVAAVGTVFMGRENLADF